MARRRYRKRYRKKKKNDADLVTAIVVFFAAVFLLNPQVIKAIIAIGIVSLIIIVAVWVIRNQGKNQNKNYQGKDTKLSIKENSVSDLEHESKVTATRKNPATYDVDDKKPIPERWSLELINSLEWKVFEDLCAAYFVAKGLKAEVTDIGADGGIDVLLYSHTEQDRVVGIIQCKAWFRKQVGVKDIRELYGIMMDKNSPLGVYITTSSYSEDAKAFAGNKRIELWSSLGLFQEISKLSEDKQKQLLSKIVTSDYSTPTCPSCGVKMKVRTSRRSGSEGYKFWGCRNFPRCCYKMKIRSGSVLG